MPGRAELRIVESRTVVVHVQQHNKVAPEGVGVGTQAENRPDRLGRRSLQRLPGLGGLDNEGLETLGQGVLGKPMGSGDSDSVGIGSGDSAPDLALVLNEPQRAVDHRQRGRPAGPTVGQAELSFVRDGAERHAAMLERRTRMGQSRPTEWRPRQPRSSKVAPTECSYGPPGFLPLPPVY